MSSQTAKLSQKDYLKKYLSGGTDGKKKKKKKPKGSDLGVRAKVKVIDDDVDISKLQPIDESALDLYGLSEEAPQVVGIVDERPAELQALDQYKQSQRWKVLGNPDGDVSISVSGGSKRSRTVSVSSNEEEEFSVRPMAKSSNKGGTQQRKSLDSSPQRRRRQDDSDESPPRMKRPNHADESPPRRRKQYDSDTSPQRRPAKSQKSYQRYDSDTSPPRKRNQNDSDTSPPRKGRRHSSDESPPRKRKQDDSNISSSRRKRHSDSDASPPRKSQSDRSHRSPQTKQNRSSFRDKEDSDTSPPRKRTIKREPEECSSSRPTIKQERDDNTRRGDKMKTTLDGKVAGLQDAKKLKQELMEFKQREEKVFAKMDDSLSGRGAMAVQRDRKTGLKRDFELEQAEQRAKDEKENKKLEKYSRWGKGLKQTEDQQERLSRDLHEMAKPLARYADDKDLDSYLRDQDREGDPMLEYLRSKKKDEAKSKVPVYQGSFPPNRYNIRPGYRWDGVDRSNGYEKKRFEAINAKKAVEEEAYKWSTSDM